MLAVLPTEALASPGLLPETVRLRDHCLRQPVVSLALAEVAPPWDAPRRQRLVPGARSVAEADLPSPSPPKRSLPACVLTVCFAGWPTEVVCVCLFLAFERLLVYS